MLIKSNLTSALDRNAGAKESSDLIQLELTINELGLTIFRKMRPRRFIVTFKLHQRQSGRGVETDHQKRF